MNFKNIQTDLNDAINEVLAKHGCEAVQIDLRRFRGTDKKVRLMKIDFDEKGSDLAAPAPRPFAIVGSGDPLLAEAMRKFGIASTVNSKGDELIAYVPSRPKYPFVYKSIRGARWKSDIAQARARFGIA